MSKASTQRVGVYPPSLYGQGYAISSMRTSENTLRVKSGEHPFPRGSVNKVKKTKGRGFAVFKAVNSGDTVHALKVEGEGIEEETEEIEPGQSAELKVKLKAGTYELCCPVDGHAEEGMEGKLTVREGSGGSGGY